MGNPTGYLIFFFFCNAFKWRVGLVEWAKKYTFNRDAFCGVISVFFIPILRAGLDVSWVGLIMVRGSFRYCFISGLGGYKWGGWRGRALPIV
jgi:hypothetical protein